MEKLRITFKKEPRITGLMGVGYPYQGSDIKVNGKVCGHISAPNWQTKDHKWGVRFMVFTDIMENTNWKWITLTARFDSDEEARAWIKERIQDIVEKYQLRGED